MQWVTANRQRQLHKCTSEAGRFQNQITALFFSSIFVFQIYLKEEAIKHKKSPKPLYPNISILIYFLLIFIVSPSFYIHSYVSVALVSFCILCIKLSSLPPTPPPFLQSSFLFIGSYQVIHHHLLDDYFNVAWLSYHILTLITITILSFFIYRTFSFELLSLNNLKNRMARL